MSLINDNDYPALGAAPKSKAAAKEAQMEQASAEVSISEFERDQAMAEALARKLEKRENGPEKGSTSDREANTAITTGAFSSIVSTAVTHRTNIAGLAAVAGRGHDQQSPPGTGVTGGVPAQQKSWAKMAAGGQGKLDFRR